MSNGITDAELEQLRSAKNEIEWNAACDAVKKAHGGYPHDWFLKVMISGLAAEVAKNWGRPDAFDIKLVPISIEDLKSGKY
jgi:hypothetical protein